LSADPPLEQGRAEQGKTQKSVVKLVKQPTKNKKRTKKKMEEEEEEEEGPFTKKRKKGTKRTKTKKEEDEEDEEDEEQAEEEEEEKEDAKEEEEEPVAKKPRKPKTVPQTQKRKFNDDDVMCNGQNIDTAGPLGKLFKQRETKEKEAGEVAHQNSANLKVQMTQQFRKEAIDRITAKQMKNKDSEEAKKTAATQKKNKGSEEDKPQEEVLHGLSIEELKNLKVGDAIKTWYATHSKWFTGKVVKVHKCSLNVAYDDKTSDQHRFDGGWIINRVS